MFQVLNAADFIAKSVHLNFLLCTFFCITVFVLLFIFLFLKQTISAWRTIFWICAVVMIFDAIEFVIFGSGEQQPWNQQQQPAVASVGTPHRPHQQSSSVPTATIDYGSAGYAVGDGVGDDDEANGPAISKFDDARGPNKTNDWSGECGFDNPAYKKDNVVFRKAS